jgi:hypothetical protein
MKLYGAVLLGVLAVMPLVVPRAALADNWSVSVSVGQVRDFYEPLSRHGYWVDVAPHGRCWYPAYVEHDWRPYAEGYWLWTDSGWYWVSEEPWAWATYHYGRWVLDSYYGWIWVPDTDWGPAWVSWREGGDYVGWAPLPPRCREFGPDGVLIIGANVIAPGWFVFVEHRHFCRPVHRRNVIINQTIINQTVNITNIRRRGDHTIINNGPDLDVVRRHIGHGLEARPVNEIRQAETEWRREQGSSGRARGKLPLPIVSATEEPGLGWGRHRETAVVAPGVHGNEAAATTGPEPALEYGKPKGKEFIEKGAEKPPKSPSEQVRIPDTTRSAQGKADVVVPRSEQPQGPQEWRQERSEGREKLDRGSGNALPGNYGNFPTGKAYGKPRGASPSAPEVVQPRAPGGRTPVSEDSHGRDPERSSGKGRG